MGICESFGASYLGDEENRVEVKVVWTRNMGLLNEEDS